MTTHPRRAAVPLAKVQHLAAKLDRIVIRQRVQQDDGFVRLVWCAVRHEGGYGFSPQTGDGARTLAELWDGLERQAIAAGIDY